MGVRDTAFVTEKKVLEPQLDDEMENLQIFVKLTEEDRRERNLRIDLGEDSARLKIPNQNHGNQNRGGWDNDWKQDWNKPDWKQGQRNQGSWSNSGAKPTAWKRSA